jgi:carbonic anhydrase
MHKIKACVITCIDFRFQKNIKDYLVKNDYLGEADIISVAGASHDIATPQTPVDQNYLMNQIGISVSLHNPDKIIIVDHQDCGMYAATGKIEKGLDLPKDTEKHTNYLLKAKELIQQKYNNIEVVLLMAGLDGSFTEIQ